MKDLFNSLTNNKDSIVSWLQNQFSSVATGIIENNWVRTHAESILGKDFLKSALGTTINYLDETPDVAADDSKVVRDLKGWKLGLG